MNPTILQNKHLCMIGYSGHAFVVVETLLSQGFIVKGYCDFAPKETDPYGLKYFGPEHNEEVLSQLDSSGLLFFPSVGNNQIRRTIYERLSIKLNSVIAIHSTATISSTATINYATFIAQGAIIQAQARLGTGVICNSGSIIEHECVIEDFSHIAPGAVLCGNVHVGSGTLIGAGAVINPGVTIGENAVIGSGSVVLNDVPANTVFAGNPAKNLKYRL